MSTGVLQKLLWHAKLLFRITSSSDFPTTFPRELIVGGESKTTSQPARKQYADSLPKRLEQAASVERALRLAGVTREDPETVAYFKRFAEKGFLLPKDVVRDGPLLSSQEKSQLGIKTRAYVGSVFVSYLNQRGLADPVEAGCRITSIINKQRWSAGDLERGPDVLDGDIRLKFFPSNMADGPCPKAAALSKALIIPSEEFLLPFNECTHPDQCGCRYLMKSYSWE